MKKLFLLMYLVLGLYAEDGMLEASKFADIPKGAKMIEFGATSCMSCQEMDRLLYTLKKENPKLPLYFVNIMKDMKVAQEFKISLIPTQVFIDSNNTIVARHVGKLSKEELLEMLKKYKIGE